MAKLPVDEQLKILSRGMVDLHTADDLRAKLATGKPLRVKLGVDPTAPELHLGHTVVLNKLRAFQDLGHVAILILGDFTGRVGDPSGRDKTRPLITEQELRKNAETYWAQASKILKPDVTDDLDNTDPEKTVVVYNSGWLDPFVTKLKDNGSTELFATLSQLTVSRLLEREDFKTRLEAGHPLSMLEFLYPVFQGYDSVAIRSDVELGGTDQLFNLLVGRDLQRRGGKTLADLPQVTLTLPLLVGTDGVKKMSKSYGNHIGVQHPPSEIFGRVMSVPDAAMWDYYTLLTGEDVEAMKKLHPMEAKKRLGELLVARFHGPAAAKDARDGFEKQFSRKELPADIAPLPLERAGMTIVEVMVAGGLAASKNEARRLIDQKAVKVDGQTWTDYAAKLDPSKEGVVLKVGSRHLRRVLPAG